MSLIFDALQKAENDNTKKAGFVKVNASQAEKRRKRNKLIFLGGVSFVVIIVVVLLAVFLAKTFTSKEKEPAASPVEKKSGSQKVEKISSTPAETSPKKEPVAKAEKIPEEAESPKAIKPQDTSKGVSAPADDAVRQKEAVSSEQPVEKKEPIPAVKEKVEEKAPVSEPEEEVEEEVSDDEIDFPESRPAVLSELKIGGIIEDEESSMAIINGMVVSVGDEVRDGVIVKEIKKNSVVLTIRGKDYTIYR